LFFARRFEGANGAAEAAAAGGSSERARRLEGGRSHASLGLLASLECPDRLRPGESLEGEQEFK